jgi:hypothetical protein
MNRDNNPTDQTALSQKMLGILHFLGTLWFILCVGYILVISLRQRDVSWWTIFSLSPHTLVVMFFLISLYLYAIFRSAGRTDNYVVEHPFTSAQSYKAFYVSAPFLGGVSAVIIGVLDASRMTLFLYALALGTFGTTFLIWVILDPLMAVIETFSPESRACRQKRLSRVKAERRQKQEQRDLFLAQVIERQEESQRQWQDALKPYAERLSALVLANEQTFENAEKEAIKLGALAWQMGGIACMRYLHDMAQSLSQENNIDEHQISFISLWWDGIGSWRDPLLG